MNSRSLTTSDFQLLSIEFDAEAELEGIKFKIFVKIQNSSILPDHVQKALSEYELKKKYKLGTDIYYLDHLLGKKTYYGNKSPDDKIILTKTLFVTNRILDNVFFPQKGEVTTQAKFISK